MDTWFEVAIVATLFAIGNILFGHFEAQTPKWRRILKVLLILGLTNVDPRSLADRGRFSLLVSSWRSRSSYTSGASAERRQPLDGRAQGAVL